MGQVLLQKHNLLQPLNLMANFQFGQDNVGSGWQVPSWYVQGMSQSPMAASIAGLGNSIAAFTSGYQAAKQAERGYGLDKQRLSIEEQRLQQQGDYYKSLKEQRQEAGNEDRVIGNWLSGLGDEASRYIEWINAGRPSANSPSLQNTSQLVPATEPTLPQEQNQYSVDPYSLMSGVRQNYPTQFLQGYDPRISF